MEDLETPVQKTNRRTAGKPKSNPKQLRVYRGWCKQCGICVAFCPKKALEKDPEGYPRWKDSETCIGCHLCELRCPDFAIEVESDQKEEKTANGEGNHGLQNQ